MTGRGADETVTEFMERRRREVGSRYGNLYAPPRDDLADVRREQAEFMRRRRELDQENGWMAVPALAPGAVVLGIEGAGVIAARYAAPQLVRGPLVLTGREPYLRVGDNWSTRVGRLAHRALKAKVDQKPDWRAEAAVTTNGRLLRPDVRAPVRDPAKPRQPFQMELKPNTPSGRRAAARAAERYERETGKKTRPIYYNPKDFM